MYPHLGQCHLGREAGQGVRQWQGGKASGSRGPENHQQVGPVLLLPFMAQQHVEAGSRGLCQGPSVPAGEEALREETDVRPQGRAAVAAHGAAVGHQPLEGSRPQLGSLGSCRRAETVPGEQEAWSCRKNAPHNRHQWTTLFY